ncbi:MAG: radical SAM protein [Clostridia bacterium]|nr:radical SAM protein [Clostridia bacterium]
MRTDRSQGLCGAAEPLDIVRVAWHGLHMWEEPCLSGTRGSGTVFFSGCPLGCVFCQNRSISRAWIGERLDPSGLADRMLSLEASGAHNINLVTGAHILPAAAAAIGLARGRGLRLPVVWNSGGYETVETLRRLDGLVDIYLPDFKFMDPGLAEMLCHAPDYPDIARAAILEMARQTGGPEQFENGILKRGLIVRHLVLPGCHTDSLRILEWLAGHLPLDTRLSILAQYTPMPDGRPEEVAEERLARSLRRRITTYEYEKVVGRAVALGFTRILGQDRDSADNRYIPPFPEAPSASL